jgi:undecaprenyl-diphosphatase
MSRNGLLADVDEETGDGAPDRAYLPQFAGDDGDAGVDDVFARKSYLISRDELLPDRERFCADFPASLERTWATFDDLGIALCQSSPFRTVAWYYVSLFVTGVFAVETLVTVPVIALACGHDGLATELAILALLAAAVSQVPKRFVYRERPYLVRRALQCRADVTSSFPSRTALVAVVAAFAVGYACNYGDADTAPAGSVVPVYSPGVWVYAGLVPAFLAVASFARINLGVHYPSDCLAGAVLGGVVCALGSLLHHADVLGCTSCSRGECYTAGDSPRALTAGHLERVNVPLLLGFTMGALAAVGGAVLPPLRFWGKAHHVFGTLLACVAFQLCFLCPPFNPGLGSLPPPQQQGSTVGSVVFGLAVSALSLALGRVGVRGGAAQRIIRFLVVYATVFVLIAAWRLVINP